MVIVNEQGPTDPLVTSPLPLATSRVAGSAPDDPSAGDPAGGASMTAPSRHSAPETVPSPAPTGDPSINPTGVSTLVPGPTPTPRPQSADQVFVSFKEVTWAMTPSRFLDKSSWSRLRSRCLFLRSSWAETVVRQRKTCMLMWGAKAG